jgi:hypothetical protein
MFKNFILIKDKIFSKKECNDIINTYSKICSKGENNYSGYDCYDINNFNYIDKILPVIEEYKKKFKGIELTPSKWTIGRFRFKHFKPGKHFSLWHSEHSLSYLDRVLNVQVYLSTHNCGTEFLDYKTVKSKVGRVAIFPSYFTHTHKGQICPDNKNRYILTSYIYFCEKGKGDFNEF